MQSFRARLLQCESPERSRQRTCSSVCSLQGHNILQAHLPPPAWVLHGLQKDNLCCHGLHHRLQEPLLWLPEHLFTLPSFLTFMPAGLFLSHFSHPSLLKLLCCIIFCFLNDVVTEVPPESLMGSALAEGDCFEAIWNQFYPTWVQPLVSSHRSDPCSPNTDTDAAPLFPQL